MSVIQPWKESHDGNFGEIFIKRCLTRIEMGELLQPLPQSIGPDSNYFRASKGKSDSSTLGSDIRKTLVDVVLTWTNVYAGGVILKSASDRTKLFLVFEFISAHKRVMKSHFDDKNSVDPLVYVSYASSPSMRRAELLLRDEDIEVITCSDEVLFEFERLFRASFSKSGLIDIVSNLTVVEGYLEPIHPPLSPLPMVGGQMNIKNKEEECETDDVDDEYNDSFEFEEEIKSIDDFERSCIADGDIKQEFNGAKNAKVAICWKRTMFTITMFSITIAVLSLYHEEGMKEIFRSSEETFKSFNGRWTNIALPPIEFPWDLFDSKVTKLVDVLYKITTNYVNISV